MTAPNTKPLFGTVCTEPRYLEALDVMTEVAKLTHKDRLLRELQRETREVKGKTKAEASPAYPELRRAAEAEMRADEERRETRRALERDAALKDVAAKKALEDAKAASATARREALETVRLAKQEEDTRRRAKAADRLYQRWLQVEYPRDLARRLLAWQRSLPERRKKAWHDFVAAFLTTQGCNRDTVVPHLWDADVGLTRVACNVRGVLRAAQPLRCSAAFEWLLFDGSWAEASGHDAGVMLLELLDKILPGSRRLFTRRYTAAVMFREADYVAEKAFVYAVILLSKWFGEDFPGVHAWPPAKPG